MNKTIKERVKLAEKMKRNPETPFVPVLRSESPMSWPCWMTRCYRNNRYMVMIDDYKHTTHGYATCAMVQAIDAMPIPSHWSEMQRIKNEIFGPETVAVEYYPAESKLINDHNIYWLWIFPDGVLPLKK